MAKSVNLEIITPSKLFYKGDVEIVICKTLSGEEGFMANHAWACKLLGVGEMWIQEIGSKDFKVAAISGGYVDVKDSIVIYTDAAEWSEDIDLERALSEKAKAEDWLVTHKDANDANDANDIILAKAAIDKAITRMSVAAGGSKKKR